MHFVIAHPEFWDGGAERLLFSLIRSLRQNGHTVEIYCAFMNEMWYRENFVKRSEVNIVGSSLVGGDWHMQMILFALKILLSGKPMPDVFLADNCPAALPIVRFLMPKTKILFYMHHPHHLMLAPVTEIIRDGFGILMGWYFWFVSFLESYCLSHADLVLSNSYFTKNVVHHWMRDSFPSYKSGVLYPTAEISKPVSTPNFRSSTDLQTFTTLGRFWPVKKLDLLIDAALHLRETLSQKDWSKIRIRFAGSVDKVMPFSQKYLEILRNFAAKEKLQEISDFFADVSEERKQELLGSSAALIFTPQFEHFGIVPIEALLSGTRVIAFDAAGPKESLAYAPSDGVLVKWYSPICFAEAMADIMERNCNAQKFDDRRNRLDLFSFEHFSETFVKSLTWLGE